MEKLCRHPDALSLIQFHILMLFLYSTLIITKYKDYQIKNVNLRMHEYHMVPQVT